MSQPLQFGTPLSFLLSYLNLISSRKITIIKKTIVGYLPRRGPKGILGVNTIITEGVEEAMTKGRDQWGNNGRTKVTGEAKNKAGVSTEETEKLYNS